jgi:acetyl/propionyl-CoA carboxylase alpha subunit
VGAKWANLSASSRGHAIEVRVYAEDPDNNFMPTSGKIKTVKVIYDLKMFATILLILRVI